MASRPQKPGPAAVHAVERLNSWKEIAAYLDTSVRTVQRWEQVEGLPVHRHEHAHVSTVYAYTSEVDAWFGGRRTPALASARPKRLIVLPFHLLRPDPEIEFLSLGLADAVTASLSVLESVIVRSSLTAARYAGQLDLPRIVAETSVDQILTGTILRSGEQLSVRTQLVEGAGGSVLWSQTSQGSVRDIFALQEEIAGGVIESIAPPLSAREQTLLRHDVPANPAAYAHYLRANELAYDFDPSARDLYLQCVEEDSNFAPAWARLARCCRIVAKFGGDPENFNRAEAALRKALSLNPELAVAHNQLAYLEADSGRADSAMVRLLQRARVARNDPELFAGLVHVCRYCGLLEASVAAHEHAWRLDPTIRTSVCHTHFLRGDYQKALDTSKEVLGYIGPLALISLGRDQEARALAREEERAATPLPLVRCAFSAVRSLAEGVRAEALAMSEQAVALIQHGPEELFQMARHFAYLSEPERSLTVLARAVDGGFFCYPALARDPWLHPLRTSREFQRIMRRAQERHASAVRTFVEAEGEQVLQLARG